MMEKLKFPKITIISPDGAHGRFLRYTLDKFCLDTPFIDELPFNHLGNSHSTSIKYSGQFDIPLHGTLDHKIENIENEIIIFIDVLDEILYYERVWLARARDSNTDIHSEKSIINCLTYNGSTFPAYCKSKGITIQEGYAYGFRNIEQQGSVILNKKRFKKVCSKNNDVYKYPIKNFFTLDAFESSILDIGKYFNLKFNTTDIDKLYNEFYERNVILKTQKNVEEYLSGNKNIALDIIQKAYIDAQKK